MKHLALIAALALAGCSLTPETPPAPSQALADYEPAEYETAEVQPIPSMGAPEPVDEDGDDYADYYRLTPEQADILDAILKVARANTQALDERNRQVHALAAERTALLQAGRLAEMQAHAYHGLWVGEIHQGWLDSLMYRGVTGAMLIFIAAGAL